MELWPDGNPERASLTGDDWRGHVLPASVSDAVAHRTQFRSDP